MRSALVLVLPLLASACNTVTVAPPQPAIIMPPVAEQVIEPAPEAAPIVAVEAQPVEAQPVDENALIYGEIQDEGRTIPALDVSKIAQRNFRKEVDYFTDYPVGTIIVDPYARYLYLVQPGQRAMRYSVGVGRAGMVFHGEANVAYKARWPRWTPTANMIKRNPDHYGKHAGGVEGGLSNPLGARALYLYRDGKDTLYRIHGTNEPWSIGKAASSGCIRLFNQDIIDLHKRASSGARVIVLSKEESGKGTAG